MSYSLNLSKKFSETIKGIRALISFFTIIPTGINDIYLASKFFFLIPIIGMFEGFMIYLFTIPEFNPFLKTCFIFFMYFIITGLLHMDGFLDFLDVIFSGKKGLEALKIMRQPCRGSMTIAFSTIFFIITFFLIFNLKSYERIFFIMILSLEAMFILSYLSTPTSYSYLGRLFIMGSKKFLKENVLTFVLVIFFLILIFNINLLYIIFAILIMLISVFLTYKISSKTLGFVNGDVLGFCFEVTRFLLLIFSVLF